MKNKEELKNPDYIELTEEQLMEVTGGVGNNPGDEVVPGVVAGYCPTCLDLGKEVFLTGDYNRTQGLMMNIHCPNGHTFPDLPW